MPKIDPPAPKKSAPGTLPPDGAFFAGMDKDKYPGDRVMQSLFASTNLRWTGFYLTPAPSQGHNLGWMGKHLFLRVVGWGVAPIYVGRQVESIKRTDHRMTPENGTIDGGDAADLAISTGISPPSVIYLDFENGPPLEAVQKSYYAAWAAALRARGYSPGVYCLHGLAAGLLATVPGSIVWGVNVSKFPKRLFKNPFPQPDPGLSGAANATLWQLKQEVTIEYDDILGGKRHIVVDLNSSRLQDPSGRS